MLSTITTLKKNVHFLLIFLRKMCVFLLEKYRKMCCTIFNLQKGWCPLET